MKQYLRLGFVVAAVMFAFNVIAITEAKAQNILPEILKRMDEHQKALKSLKANVMMDKFNAQLGEHDITEGTVQYVPTKERIPLIRIDWVKPAQETLVVSNKQYIVYTPRLNRAIVGSAEKADKNTKTGNALSFISMSKDQLRANYNVKYLGQENVSGSIQTWHLELTPKAQQSYKLAELWVDGNGMPLQAKITENNNDTQTILLSSLNKNVSISSSVFSLKLPKGTEVVKP